MNWARVTLPDAGEPWRGKSARLQVTQSVEPFSVESGVRLGPDGGAPTALVKVFHLLVYTDEQVIEVGQLFRR